jgi:hypothetical protein
MIRGPGVKAATRDRDGVEHVVAPPLAQPRRRGSTAYTP